MESEENGKQLQEISKRESIVSGDLQDANAESEHLKEAYETLEQEVAELDSQLTEKADPDEPGRDAQRESGRPD